MLKKMIEGHLAGHNRSVFPFFLVLFVFFSLTASVAADNLPTVDVDVSPVYAGIGDAVTVKATARDDYGVRLIYFYSPDASDFTAEDCGDLSSCTKSVTKTVGLLGDNRFCVKALDTANQVSSLVCGTVQASADRLPIIKYFHGVPQEGDTPTVHVEGTVKFEIIAEDDKGVKKIALQDMATGKVDEHECASLKTCIFEISKTFNTRGTYKFCTWAQDTTLKDSAMACIDVNVVAKYSCDYITLDNAEGKENVALRLTSKRLHPDVDGLAGYSAQCCKDAGYCTDLKIDAQSCKPMGGDIPAGEYKVIEWFPDQTPLEDLLFAYQYPQILCTSNSPTNVSLGIIENARYGVVGEIQNLEDNTMKYWLAGSSDNSAALTSGVEQRRYFIAEQLQMEDNETKVTTLVDSQKYSEAINRVMENECDEKDLESGECHFDCLDAKCNPTAPCGSGNCLGCPKSPQCECCPQCHKVSNYKECTYTKYKNMYGRPYADYLFCWKVPVLKDTPWCYQKSDQPTSTVNFPWYGFTRRNDGYYRSLDKIQEEYINEMHKWNENVQVDEKPAAADISEKLWTPEAYCDHNFDPKLFRSIWTKIFTSTPFLNDLRNNMTFTKTGPGMLYAGGGFRREPACWWESCRRCGPYTDCACSAGPNGQPCCAKAYFSPTSVNNLIEITLPYTTVPDGPVQITYGTEGTVATVDNGAIKVISTGNEPFSVAASFSKDESSGVYSMNLVYTPTGGFSGNVIHTPEYDQFIIDQDITLNYSLGEDAQYFRPMIKESFSTMLLDTICKCTCPKKDPVTGKCICPPGCGASASSCCCPAEVKPVVTAEEVVDSQGTIVLLNTRKIDALKLAANNFVDLTVTKGIQVGLVGFSNCGPCCSPGGICSWQGLSDKAGPLHASINEYQPTEGTCISCGINMAESILASAGGEKHIIVMSDGIPQCCAPGGGFCGEDAAKAEAKASAAAAKAAGVTVHTVVLGSAARGEVDVQFMKDLAEAGGGRFYPVVCECPLDCIYKELAKFVKGNVVLVNDVTGSMIQNVDLNCPPEGTPIIHKFGILNLTITGTIDNYLDESIATGARSKGTLNIKANPDIINRLTLNVEGSSLDYYSLFYPVKHEAYRKEYAHGTWIPGYPYVVGGGEKYDPLEEKRTYTFDDAYGYESAMYDYPEQCNQICPGDCTCPAEDITDVTCTDADGNKFKRTDCVCLPPLGQSYRSPCTSTRDFHEEENYYFDFVDLETREVSSDINLMGKKGTNPQFTGSLRGEVGHNLKPKETPQECGEKPPETWALPENAVLLPTDPDDAGAGDYQKEPLLVHGLAWYIAKCAEAPSACGLDEKEEIKIGRMIGPLDIGPARYNSGPYVVLSARTEAKQVVKKILEQYRDFGNVDYNTIDTRMNAKVTPLAPVRICVKDGDYDQPSKLFDEMGVPFSFWGKDCLATADVLVFGCPQGPMDSATVDDIRKFVSQCGTFMATDLSYDAGSFKKIFPGYFTATPTGRDGAVIWEGGTRGAYDLPDDLKRYFQTPYETLDGWKLAPGTMVIDKIDSGDVKILARGDYSTGGTDKAMAVTFKYGSGRVLYSPIHIESGVASPAAKTFMASFYSSAGGATKNKPVDENKTNTYVLDFEALNFPSSILKYSGGQWENLGPMESCAEYCSAGGAYAASECAPAYDPNARGCVYCKTDQNGRPVNFLSGDCNARCGSEYTERKCCCALASFNTEDANMTIYIHFRDNMEDQTFKLFPSREEIKPYAQVKVNVKIRNPSRITCRVSPENANAGQDVNVTVTLQDALTGAPISGEDVLIEREGYYRTDKLKTDDKGIALLKFKAEDQSTRIICSYGTESSGAETVKGRVLLYRATAVEDLALSGVIESAGWGVDNADRNTKITSGLLSQYAQVWFIDNERKAVPFDQDEITAITEYSVAGGSILLTGEGAGKDEEANLFTYMIGPVAQEFGVTVQSPLLVESDQINGSCVSAGFSPHPVTDGLKTIGSSGTDMKMTSNDGTAKTVASIKDDTGADAAAIQVREEAGRGRVIFDGSYSRFESAGLDACDDTKYAQNAVNWLGEDAEARMKAATKASSYTPSTATASLNIYSLNRFWWFISPEVLLLFIVLVILAFSYRWFSGRGLDISGMWDELGGKK